MKTSKTHCRTLAQTTASQNTSPSRPLGTLELRLATRFSSTVISGFAWRTKLLLHAIALRLPHVTLLRGKSGQQLTKLSCIMCQLALLFLRAMRIKRKRVCRTHFCQLLKELRRDILSCFLGRLKLSLIGRKLFNYSLPG